MIDAEMIERAAIAIYYDDPEPDLDWDDLGNTIKDQIRHIAEIALASARG